MKVWKVLCCTCYPLHPEGHFKKIIVVVMLQTCVQGYHVWMCVWVPTTVIEILCVFLSFSRYFQMMHDWHSLFMRRFILVLSSDILIVSSGCFPSSFLFVCWMSVLLYLPQFDWCNCLFQCIIHFTLFLKVRFWSGKF